MTKIYLCRASFRILGIGAGDTRELGVGRLEELVLEGSQADLGRETGRDKDRIASEGDVVLLKECEYIMKGCEEIQSIESHRAVDEDTDAGVSGVGGVGVLIDVLNQ